MRFANPKPSLPRFPIGQIRVHETLEDLPVIGGEPMDEFVDNHELAQVLREFNQFRVQRQATNTRK